MTLRLFEHPLSPYSQKVKISLYEKGIPFDRVFIDPNEVGSDLEWQEFVLASARREVPALVDGDLRLSDSTIILEYLDERYTPTPLFPESPAERARVRQLEEMMDTEYEAVNWGVMEVKVFGRAAGEHASQLLTRAAVQLQRLWNRLEREFEGRQWLNGMEYGRGDIAAYPHIAGSKAFGFAIGDRHPRLLDWEKRVASRSAVKRVLMESAEFMHRLRENSSPRPPRIVRQYRDHRLEWMIKTGGVAIVVEGLENGTIRFASEYE